MTQAWFRSDQLREARRAEHEHAKTAKRLLIVSSCRKATETQMLAYYNHSISDLSSLHDFVVIFTVLSKISLSTAAPPNLPV